MPDQDHEEESSVEEDDSEEEDSEEDDSEEEDSEEDEPITSCVDDWFSMKESVSTEDQQSMMTLDEARELIRQAAQNEKRTPYG